jgi:hypothetical protein
MDLGFRSSGHEQIVYAVDEFVAVRRLYGMIRFPGIEFRCHFGGVS